MKNCKIGNGIEMMIALRPQLVFEKVVQVAELPFPLMTVSIERFSIVL